jgi:Tat protein translocase TatB subunit
MDILGIGFPELILIFIIALVVFGPRRLPEIAAKMGKTVADLRNMSQGLMTEWQREIAVATRVEEIEKTRQELEEIKKDVQQTKKGITAEAVSSVNELAQTRKALEEEIKATPSSTSDADVAETSSQPENTIAPAGAPSETTTPPAAASPNKPENGKNTSSPPSQPLPSKTSPAEVASE